MLGWIKKDISDHQVCSSVEKIHKTTIETDLLNIVYFAEWHEPIV